MRLTSPLFAGVSSQTCPKQDSADVRTSQSASGSTISLYSLKADTASFSQRPQNQPHFEGREKNETKKRAGRPRVDLEGTTAADRRRTQIRLAQRAYRQRKETTITTLQSQVDTLQSHVNALQSQLKILSDFIVSQNGPSKLQELLGSTDNGGSSPKSQSSEHPSLLDAEGESDYEEEAPSKGSNNSFYQNPNNSSTKVTEFLTNADGSIYTDSQNQWWQKVKEGTRFQDGVYEPFALLPYGAEGSMHS